MKFKICLTLLALLAIGGRMYAQTTEFDVNGLKVIFRHSDKYSVSAVMFYRGGTANYNAQQQGIEDLAVNAAVSCGTEELNKDQFKDLADKYSISIGGSASYDYSYIGMSCVKPYFNEGWRLFGQAILHPSFEEQEYALTQQKLIANIKQNDGDPDAMLDQMSMENAFAGSRYAYKPGGNAETMARFNLEQARNYYYNTLLNKNRMLLVVVGNLDVNSLKRQVSAAFGKLPAGAIQLPVAEDSRFSNNNLKTVERGLATNYIQGVLGAPSVSNKKENYAYKLAFRILADKLFEEVRTKRNLSYAPAAYASSSFKPYSTIYVTTTKPKEAVEVMVNEVKRLRNNGFTEVDLRDAKSQFATSYFMNKQSTYSMAYSLGIAELNGSWKDEEAMLQRLQDIKLPELQQVFNKYTEGIRWNYLGDTKLADQEAFDKRVKEVQPPKAGKMEVRQKKG
jgi:predicted Zn-dependent peptidase